MIHAHVIVVAAERDMLAVAFREEAELDKPNRERIRRRRHEYDAMFLNAIVLGQRTGFLRSGDPDLLVRAVLGMCNWMYQWYDPARESADDVAAEFALLLEVGWLKNEAKRAFLPRVSQLADGLTSSQAALERAQAELAGVKEALQQTTMRLNHGLLPGR